MAKVATTKVYEIDDVAETRIRQMLRLTDTEKVGPDIVAAYRLFRRYYDRVGGGTQLSDETLALICCLGTARAWINSEPGSELTAAGQLHRAPMTAKN